MVVAVIVGSGLVWAFDLHVAQLRDIIDIPRSLPTPELPLLRVVPELILPAVSLAYVGLIQGAGISANFPNPDGTYPDVSRDFVGQGAANVACGFFQGMPVGGSMSATSLVTTAGARSRIALVAASVTMAVVILVFGGVAGYIAMPTLAGLLIVVGISTILYVVGRSNRVSVMRWRIEGPNDVIEEECPSEVPHDAVVVLEPYGSLFFVSASIVP